MPPQEQYNGRLPRDISKNAKQYISDREISKSELVRRAVTDFLEQEGYQ